MHPLVQRAVKTVRTELESQKASFVGVYQSDLDDLDAAARGLPLPPRPSHREAQTTPLPKRVWVQRKRLIDLLSAIAPMTFTVEADE